MKKFELKMFNWD